MARDDRTIINIHEAAFRAYDLEGSLQDDMSYFPISYSRETRRGIYVIRMQPGAVINHHTHGCREELLILEGELIENDGTVLKKGDFTSYKIGSQHSVRTETGCLFVGLDWDAPGDQPSADGPHPTTG